MPGHVLRRKQPFYLGLLLTLAGVGLRWVIETALVADHRIEQASYVIAIGVIQFLVVAFGLFLIIKQPALKPPRLADLALAGTSLALTFVLLEIGARLWLNFI